MKPRPSCANSNLSGPGARSSNLPTKQDINTCTSFTGLCYCQKPRDVGKIEYQCSSCLNWFHEQCVRVGVSNPAAFMVNYTFHCKNCSRAGIDSIVPRSSSFTHLCITALANLTWIQQQSNQKKSMFSFAKDIVPYIESNWEKLTSMPMSRRLKQTWRQSIEDTMKKETTYFHSAEVKDGCGSSVCDFVFGLLESDLSKIGPAYGPCAQFKTVSSKFLDVSKSSNGVAALPAEPVPVTVADANSIVASAKGVRNPKRKAAELSNQWSAKKPRVGDTTTKLVASGAPGPGEYPFNRDGYRYFLAEPDRFAPNTQEFDRDESKAGKPIPSYFYRISNPDAVLWSPHDRAPQMKYQDDRLTITGEKGYSVARCTHSVNRGDWYFEVEILDQPEGSHTRIGWAQDLACIQAPVGYDKLSYAWRSRKGTVFHDSIGKHYAACGYGKSDVVGFLISLPANETAGKYLPDTHKESPLVKFRSYLYFEEKDEVQQRVKSLKTLPNSRIICFKNGVPQGVAYSDIYRGNYFPAISLFRNITALYSFIVMDGLARANFGPVFRYPPSRREHPDVHPMSERAREHSIEQCLSDMLFYAENQGQLNLEVCSKD